MALNKSDFVPKLEGNILLINNKPAIKAADSRGLVVLENVEKMLKGLVFKQVTLTYEKATLSWVDNLYRHVLFNLDSELAIPVMEEYLLSESKKARQTPVAGLDYALATDGGVAIVSTENNFVNASEAKRRTTTTKEKTPTTE